MKETYEPGGGGSTDLIDFGEDQTMLLDHYLCRRPRGFRQCLMKTCGSDAPSPSPVRLPIPDLPPYP